MRLREGRIAQGLKPSTISLQLRRATLPLGGFPARALIQNNTAKEFFSSLLGPAGDNNKSPLPAITDND
jgi:hypothetical protein